MITPIVFCASLSPWPSEYAPADTKCSPRKVRSAPRDLLREKGTPYAELGLADPKWSDDELIDFMLAHPILINRPIVVTARGARLCRPSELVLELLDKPVAGFGKEDGEGGVLLMNRMPVQARPVET